MFAVVKIGGKQFKVAQKDIILVSKVDGKEGDTLEFSEVLLVSDDKKVSVGKPFVEGAKVTAKVLGQEQGKKVTIRRFKAKVRYRRHAGFRAQLTRLEITGIAKA